jgi:hypothetical protein
MDTQNLYLFVKGILIAIPDDYLGVFHWVWRRDGDDEGGVIRGDRFRSKNETARAVGRCAQVALG